MTDEQVEDVVGGMFTGNTETNITSTYDDASGKINLAVAGSSGGTPNALAGIVSREGITGGSDINIPVGSPFPALGTSYTQIYRYTNTNTTSRAIHLTANLAGHASWESTGGGSRAIADVRVRLHDSSAGTTTTIGGDYQWYVRNLNVAGWTNHSTISITTAAELDQNDYIQIEAVAARQETPGTGNVVVESTQSAMTVITVAAASGGTTPPPVTDTFYTAVKTSKPFTATDFTSSTLPSYTGSLPAVFAIPANIFNNLRYFGIFVPDSSPITMITEDGGGINQFGAFTARALTVSGEVGKVYESNRLFLTDTAIQTWRIS